MVPTQNPFYFEQGGHSIAGIDPATRISQEPAHGTQLTVSVDDSVNRRRVPVAIVPPSEEC